MKPSGNLSRSLPESLWPESFRPDPPWESLRESPNSA